VICQLRLNEIYSMTTPFGLSSEESFDVLRHSNNNIVSFF
jgi:hypothetical protein